MTTLLQSKSHILYHTLLNDAKEYLIKDKILELFCNSFCDLEPEKIILLFKYLCLQVYHEEYTEIFTTLFMDDLRLVLYYPDIARIVETPTFLSANYTTMESMETKYLKYPVGAKYGRTELIDVTYPDNFNFNSISRCGISVARMINGKFLTKEKENE